MPVDSITRRPPQPEPAPSVRKIAAAGQAVRLNPANNPPLAVEPQAIQPAKPIAKPAPVSGELSGIRKWSTMVVLSLALAIIIIDTTVLNVSLRAIILDLHTNIQSLQWVISAYSLTLAALTVTGGRMGDLFGRKKMFMIGAVIFAIGSFTASISHSVGVLLAGESIIEGIGAAMMMPATSSLLVSTFSGRQRAMAFGIWGGIAAASAAIGPILGGYLTTHYSWRWAFRINVGVAVLLLLGSILIQESRDREEAPNLDWLGVILSSTGLLAVVYGIIEASTYGWFKAKAGFAIFGHAFAPWGLSVTPVTVAAGAAILLLFALWQGHQEKVGRTPLVSNKLFRNGQFTSGALTMATLSLGQVGLFFALPVFLQAVRGLDALHTGYSLLPMSLTLLVAAPTSAIISRWIKPKRIIQLGLVIDLAASLLLQHSMGVDATAATLAPGLIIYGLGMGLVMAQVSNLTLSAVSVQEAGEASGVNNTLRQVGSTLGSAAIGAVLLSALATNLNHGIANSPVLPDPLKPKIEAAIAGQTSAVEFGGGNHFDSRMPQSVQAEIKRISNQATADANKKALLYMAGFVAMALLVSTKLPNVQNLEKGQSAAAAH